MRAEIFEQPAAVAATLDDLLPLAGEIERLGAGMRQVLFIARGSSDNAAVYGQYLCSLRAGRLGVLASPSVATAYHAAVDLSGVLAVAVSQSGRTDEIVATQDWARSCGARCVAITNDGDSPLASRADVALVTRAGKELAVPATKTFTTQLAALAVLGLALGGDRTGLDELRAVPDALSRALDVAGAAEALAERLTYVQQLVVSARGYAYAIARELALKLEEACYVTALGLSYADLEHGPIAVVDADTPALLIAAERDTAMLAAMTALARRCAEDGGHVYGIGGDAEFAAACRAVLPDPGLPAELAPLTLVVPGQLLVEALARAKGIDPDVPRGLRKVTQTSA
jgi:glucosamine 6-phosphate synthetase-like amidotransferase/phosphosugar isomerase protein